MTFMNCLSCGQDANYKFKVLEIRTLHVRDLPGDKRIQGLGEFKDYAICTNCAHRYLNAVVADHRKEWRQYLIFGGILLSGVVVSCLFWSEGPFRLVGLAAIVCGILGLISKLQEVNTQRQAYRSLSLDRQLEKAAYEYMLTIAPHKQNLDDLTYIPVNEETLQLKNGDLMILYKLLPAIAVEAYNRLHQ